MKPPFTFPDWSDQTVIIAEDIDSNFVVLSALLKKTNLRLLRARNGKEVMNLLTDYPDIKVILMDVSMPECDGVEASKQIRKLFSDKIVIAQTAHGLSERVSFANFHDILLKPIRMDDLIKVLKKYLP